MAEKIKIAELNIDSGELLNSLQSIKKTIREVKDANVVLKVSGEENSKAFIKNEAQLKGLSAEYGRQIKVLQATSTTTKQYTTALNAEVKSMSQAAKNNKDLKKVRNELNASTKEGAKQIALINAKLDKNTKFIKSNSSAQEKQYQNVGNYASGLAQTNPLLAKMATGLTAVRNGLLAKNAAMKASSTTTGAASAALRVFKLALISTGIGAVVVVLGSLITFLTSTQEGIDKVTAVTRPLQAVFQALIRVAQDVGGTLFKAFSEPKKLLTDLVDFVKNNVMNRFKAFGLVLEAIQNRDFGALKDAFLQGVTGVEDFTNKVKNASAAVGGFFKDAAAVGAEIDKQIKSIEKTENNLVLLRAKNSKLIKDQEALSKDTSKSGAERAKAAEEAQRLTNEALNAELALIDKKIALEELVQTQNDSGREDEKKLNELKAERYRAEEKAQATNLKFISAKGAAAKEEKARTEKQAALEKKAAEDKEALNEKEIEALKAFNERKLQLEEDARIRDAENEEEAAVLSAQIKFDRKARALEKELEDGKISEEQKTELLLLAEQDRDDLLAEIELENAEKRKEIALLDAENQAALDDINTANKFDRLRARLKKERDEEVTAAEAKGLDVSTINAKYQKLQTNLDRDEANQRLGILASTLGMASDLFAEQTIAAKLLSVAQAGINTALGVTKALAVGGFLGVLQAGTIIATGLASVAKIAGIGVSRPSTPVASSVGNKKFQDGGMLNGASHKNGGIPFTVAGTGGFEAEGGEAIINRRSTSMFQPLLSAINEAGGGKKFEAGGIVGGTSSSSGLIDSQDIANRIAEAVSKLPAPRVAVDEISTVANRVSVIENQASI